MKKFLSRVACVALCGALCFAMAGCAGANNNSDADEAAQNRAYMSQLNASLDTLEDQLDVFSEAASDGDLVKMRADASKAASAIEEIRGYSVPKKLEDVSGKYLEGLDSLQTAMNAYISLYEDIETSKSVDADSRMADIQATYDSGIKALREADDMAKDLK